MPSLGELLARERPVWIAWIILVVGNLVIAVIFPNDHSSILEQGVFSKVFLLAVLGVSFLYAYLIGLVRSFHGPGKGSGPGPDGAGQTFGVWGYVWRAYLVLLIAILPHFLLTMAYLAARKPSPPPVWFLGFLFVFAPPLIAWLWFGRGKKKGESRTPGA